MLPHAPEPISGVPRIGFLAMHDRVPVHPVRRFQIVYEFVSFFPASEMQIQARSNQAGQFGSIQQGASLAVVLQRQNPGDFLAVRRRIEHASTISARACEDALAESRLTVQRFLRCCSLVAVPIWQTARSGIMQNVMENETQTHPSYEHREGTVARTIEQQTAKIPSDVFLWAAIGSIGVSLAL